ncbi:MAG: baseplate J/gp47 family protein [Deltaproteobacteria bacterium]|nr:baseplate J/gp47 family protein [Deltaproteobacteria bacterium]
MNEVCHKKSPLSRDGTSQLQRFSPMLDPSYVLVDERSLEDLLLFAGKYAGLVRHYSLSVDESSIESWTCFFENCIAVLIADIAKTDISALKETYEALAIEVEAAPDNENYEALFQFIFDLAYRIDGWYVKSIKELSLNGDLGILIQSSLSDGLNKLIAYDKGAQVLGGWTSPVAAYDKLSSLWRTSGTAADIDADNSIYTGGTDGEKILSGLDYLNTLFESFYGAIGKIVDSAPAYMEEALEKYPQHQPHMALFLAFLKLFQYARDHLNEMTGRHLDFYYKEVLRLEEKPEVPDQVHLIFKLAKNVSSHTLEKGTLLKAGKDNSGAELFYGTEKEIVVNKAQVESLKTVFIERKGEGEDKIITNIYSAPYADSKDGLGTAFDTAEPKWKPFGESQSSKAAGEETMEKATVGFALASPQLILNEGKRVITIVFNFNDWEDYLPALLNSKVSKESFKFYFSGEKEWIEPDDAAVHFENKAMKFTLTVSEEKPAIIAYDKKVLGGTLNTSHPVLKVILNPGNTPYEYLKKLKLSRIAIDLNIDKVKNLILQSDYGKLDPNKPFQPFSPLPAIGSSFYIGNEEVFNKKIDKLTLNMEWHGLPAEEFASHYAGYTPAPANSSFKAVINVLSGKKWSENTVEDRLFSDNITTDPGISIDKPGLLTERSERPEKFSELTNNTKRGFMKMELCGSDFKHKSYPGLLSAAVATIAAGGTATVPREPYTPVIKSLVIDYESSQTFEAGREQFFHISPFGDMETLPVGAAAAAKEDKNNENDLLIVDTDVLLPQFTADKKEQEGFLYIGLTGLVPPQNVAVLFKVAEGSGDPDFEAPEINWSYLCNNEWKKLDKAKLLSDTTNGLLTTGIIEFDVPHDATNTNGVLPSPYYWLAASAAADSAAVSQFIALKTQAVTAGFINIKNDPGHLKNPLPEKTISQLKNKAAGIKSLEQPYASFNGKVKEEAEAFYRRVSERLRHKNRALNIWDYERMVLEKFPSLYKVKCLNHTASCSEIAPGSVTIVPIANLRNQNAVDMLRPKASTNTLYEIREYLKKHISQFVALEVTNPSYEQVYARFKVKFHAGVDKGNYQNVLNEDIRKFLSPWAYDEGADITFGGKIHGSYIINFIEERSYVDYLTDFELFHLVNEEGPKISVEEALATSSRTILVSSNEHDIDIESLND